MEEASMCIVIAVAAVLITVAGALPPTEPHILTPELRENILSSLTPEERHHYFGDDENPSFDLVLPRLENIRQEQDSKKLIIRSKLLTVDAVVNLAHGLVAPWLNISDDCHYRSSNLTHVVTVSDCLQRGMDGIILTPEVLATMHPYPEKLNQLLPQTLERFELVRNLWFYIQYYISFRNLLKPIIKILIQFSGYHIMYVVSQEKLYANQRGKRSTTKSHSQSFCGVNSPRTRIQQEEKPKVSSILQLQSDLDDYLSINILEDIQGLKCEHSHPFQRDRDSWIAPVNHKEEPEVEELNWVTEERKTIELAVFADDVLFDIFSKKTQDPHKDLGQFIIAIVNAVQGIYHQIELGDAQLDIQVVKMEILSSGRQGPFKSGGDIGGYLNTFCTWQKEMNPSGDDNKEHWDKAIMLSGLDLHSSGSYNVIGLAWVGGICEGQYSCSINEGRSFSSVYVVAHEMGHNLGMNHDGSGDAYHCPTNKYIMSPSTGPSKVTWSSCSVNDLKKTLRKKRCLNDRPKSTNNSVAKYMSVNLQVHTFIDEPIGRQTPGSVFSLTDQCVIKHGRHYRPAVVEHDLCEFLFCTNDVLTKPAHIPLEGSPCNEDGDRICISGKCRPQQELINKYSIKTDDIYIYIYIYINIVYKLNPQIRVNPSDEGIYPIITELEVDVHEETVVVPETYKEEGCTCSPEAPAVPSNIPQSICYFLAPVFHPLFNCTSAACSEHKLVINTHNTNYSLTKETESAVGEVCSTLTSFIGNGTEETSRFNIPKLQTLKTILNGSQVCTLIPQFMQTHLCGITEKLIDDNCPPTEIVIKTPNSDPIYYEIKKIDDGDIIRIRDKRFAKVWNSHGVLHGQVRYFLSREMSQDLNTESGLNCEVEETVPDELKGIQELCPFLSQTLQSSFECNSVALCPKHVLIVDLKKNTEMLIPAKRLFYCESCLQTKTIWWDIIWRLVGFSATIIAQQINLCELFPTFDLPVPNGNNNINVPSSSEELPSFLKDTTCRPIAVLISIESTALTYIPTSGPEGGPGINWKSQTYRLIKASTTKFATETLIKKYNLDYDKRISIISSNESFINVFFAGTVPQAVSHLLARSQNTDEDVQISGGLQDYSGASMSYAHINAPQTMAVTKVGECSVTCGVGTRILNVECVDTLTLEVSEDPTSCLNYTSDNLKNEPCYMPPCVQASYSVSPWGPCSAECGSGIQFRNVKCVQPLSTSPFHSYLSEAIGLSQNYQPSLVVSSVQCHGNQPPSVRECQGDCEQDYSFLQAPIISRDFYYA
ncbi:unnamed protein product, partial [Meganyctiphanes norvegica]